MSFHGRELTRMGLRKSRFARKWLSAWFSHATEDLQMASCASCDTLLSEIFTKSSSVVVLHMSLRWTLKPLVSTWKTSPSSYGAAVTQSRADLRPLLAWGGSHD